MNSVDLLLVLLTLLAAFIGFRFGALRLLLELFKWSASLLAGILLYTNTVEKVTKELSAVEEFYLPLSVITTFILVYTLLSFFQRMLMQSTNNSTKVHLADKLTGIVPGLFLGLMISAVTAQLLTYSVNERISNDAEKSQVAAMLSPYSLLAEEKINPLLERTFEASLPTADHKESTAEVFATGYYKTRPDLEHQMLQLINAERRKRNLKPLVADEPLRKVARAHSADMMKRGYFSHVNPEGKDPFYRMKKAGITYKKAGENLAYASTLQKAHKGLMNSPSHRAAILNKSFGRVGIGIVDGGKSGLMISQEFKD
nr:CvpA family protein [uncultured Lacibacter sp.]